MRPLLTIARNAFVESLRQPIVLVVVLLSGVLQYLNTAMSAYSMGYRTFAGEVTGDNKLLFDIGMGTMFICGILVASFIATAIVSREIENKTVLTVVFALVTLSHWYACIIALGASMHVDVDSTWVGSQLYGLCNPDVDTTRLVRPGPLAGCESLSTERFSAVRAFNLPAKVTAFAAAFILLDLFSALVSMAPMAPA